MESRAAESERILDSSTSPRNFKVIVNELRVNKLQIKSQRIYPEAPESSP